ncbi:LysR family transcriptional regulator [Thaumasiovibrio subtropicus]|uniref:LysR family transcriptional regulator n=1 Tax=Thaumasiovibrio subtropicus TaxID=1891207 RepID=UPI000B34E8B3|nr:LysR family transcriptional regulator [Thaumasiovibrio subtropicus]
MNKLLSFESLLVLDAIDRRGSFAAAAEELQRAPSSLSYQVQKLEQDLDLVIFDRSGHRAAFTKAGELLLERGRKLLNAADEMVNDAVSLAHGWELDITLGFDGIVDINRLFPLVPALEEKGGTRLHLQEEILAGSWEALSQDRIDLLIASMPTVVPNDVKVVTIGQLSMNWVASPNHPIFKSNDPLNPEERRKHRVIAVRDSAINAPPISYNILDKQAVLRVRSMSDKLKALKAGLGIGTFNVDDIDAELKSGELAIVGNDPVHTLDLVLAWRRSQMGRAKSWLIENVKKKVKLTE